MIASYLHKVACRGEAMEKQKGDECPYPRRIDSENIENGPTSNFKEIISLAWRKEAENVIIHITYSAEIMNKLILLAALLIFLKQNSN